MPQPKKQETLNQMRNQVILNFSNMAERKRMLPSFLQQQLQRTLLTEPK